MDEYAEESLVEWHDWGPEPFEIASRIQQPIILSLSASWCEACHEMDRTTYGTPQIAANIEDGFVPIRADVDQHPRVRERYNMGGFPSTVFLTPNGEIITGAGFMSIDMMRQALDTVRGTWDAKGIQAGRVPRALRDPEPPRGELTAAIEAHFVEQVAASFDEEFGGWGDGAKFPLPRTIEFAAKRDRDRALRTLEAVSAHLFDTYDGGFYRYAENRDWSDIHREKLLDENVALLRAFATGYLYTGQDSYRDTAEGAIDYLTTDLWTGDAFAGSQAGGDYYTLQPTEREAADEPVIDERIYADRNGLAVDALFRFGAYSDDERAIRYAERALEYVLDALVDGGVITHCEGGESELLVDSARLLAGLTTAEQAVGGYLDAATAVADHAVDALWEDSFLDGPRAGPGMLDRPLRPLETTVELADALVDLAALTGDESYHELARDALATFAGAHDRMSAEVASYGTACARAHYRPLVIETPEPGSDLHRAAWRVADHEKVVVPTDRDDAVVLRGGERGVPAETPDELMARAAADDPSLE